MQSRRTGVASIASWAILLIYAILIYMQKNNSVTLYCFSPAAMLTTFIVEMILAAYVLWRYQKTKSGVVITLVLVCLATFQAAEYYICEVYASLDAARLGYAAITLLPALGLHLVSLVSKKKHILVIGYTFAALFILGYTLTPGGISGAVCGGNYVVFHTSFELSELYAVYYNLLLLIGVWWTEQARKKSTGHTRSVYTWLLAGYLSFMLPTGLLYLALPSVRDAGPSIMCGFALILAIILAFAVAPPATHLERSHTD